MCARAATKSRKSGLNRRKHVKLHRSGEPKPLRGRWAPKYTPFRDGRRWKCRAAGAQQIGFRRTTATRVRTIRLVVVWKQQKPRWISSSALSAAFLLAYTPTYIISSIHCHPHLRKEDRCVSSLSNNDTLSAVLCYFYDPLRRIKLLPCCSSHWNNYSKHHSMAPIPAVHHCTDHRQRDALAPDLEHLQCTSFGNIIQKRNK